MMDNETIRVLIVDDSTFVRKMMHASLGQTSGITVVGEAKDGRDALNQIRKLRPHVVTLDVEMPVMNGIEVLEHVVGKVPVGFVMVSSLTKRGAQITLECLRKGAFDFICKPRSGGIDSVPHFRNDLIQKVIAAAAARHRARPSLALVGGASAAPKLPPSEARGWLVGIGVSCGGPQTLHELLPAFPSEFAPIVVTQHMPEGFTRSFASNLNAVCSMNVREAGDGDRIEPGTIYIAPGSHHLKVRRRGTELYAQLDGGPLVSGHRPAADVMFASIAKACGKFAVGVVLTGMGSDGAAGIQEMKRAGAVTIAQDEATSIVYGMPKVAAQTGCIDKVLPLPKIAFGVAAMLKRRTPAAAAT